MTFDKSSDIDDAIALLGGTEPPTPGPLGWQAGQTVTEVLIEAYSGVGHPVINPDPDAYSGHQFASDPIRSPSGRIVGYNNWVTS